MKKLKEIKKELTDEAQTVAKLLKEKKVRLVLAESCTGGLVSASLVQSPGISEYFCGSAVTYRNDTKTQWLGLDPSQIKIFSDVSRETTVALAEAALEKTPEATVAASVTGHLGPNAPRGEDGLVYVAISLRGSQTLVEEFRFTRPPTKLARAATKTRLERQMLASHTVLFMVRSLLQLHTYFRDFKGRQRRN